MADQSLIPRYDDLLREDRTFPPPADFRARATSATKASTPRPSAIPRRSGRGSPASSNGRAPGTRCSTGSRRTRSGSSAARSTPASTASIATSRGPRRNKAALIWEGEPGDRRTLTYYDLYREVSQFANVLKSLGVKKGDRVAIYLPLIPELAIAMLACARIGAVHSVVFGGFSAESLRDRINDSAGPAAHHRRRRLSPRADRPAEADRRRGGRRRRRRSSTSSSCSASADRVDAGRRCKKGAITGITS